MIYILYEHTCNQLFFKDSIYRLFLARIFLKILSRFFLDFFFFVSFNNCFGSIFCHKQMGKKRYGFGCSKNFVFVINITFREVGFSSFGVCRFWQFGSIIFVLILDVHRVQYACDDNLDPQPWISRLQNAMEMIFALNKKR